MFQFIVNVLGTLVSGLWADLCFAGLSVPNGLVVATLYRPNC